MEKPNAFVGLAPPTLVKRLITSILNNDWIDTDEEMLVRQELQDALIAAGGGAVEPLLHALRQHPAAITPDTITILGHLRQITAVSFLIQLLHDPVHEVERPATIAALRRIGSADAFAAVAPYYSATIPASVHFQERVAEYLRTGQTDDVLVQQVQVIAAQKCVSVRAVFIACFWHNQQEAIATGFRPHQESMFLDPSTYAALVALYEGAPYDEHMTS